VAGKQRAALEQHARSVLADMGIQSLTVDDSLRIGRPMAARLEIVHPLLADRRRSERADQMKAMEPDGGTASVMLELAQMTRALRAAGIRATADYILGCIVVSWGRQPQVSLDKIRQDLASRSDGKPPSGDVALVTWAGSPRSEVDALSGALQDAAHAIASAYRSPGPARNVRAQGPGSQPPAVRALSSPCKM
jgi:hypothetical protein